MSLSNLGNVLAQRDEYEQAERYHRRALELREAVLGLEHPDVAVSLSQLGYVCVDQGKHEQASRHFDRRSRFLSPLAGSVPA